VKLFSSIGGRDDDGKLGRCFASRSAARSTIARRSHRRPTNFPDPAQPTQSNWSSWQDKCRSDLSDLSDVLDLSDFLDLSDLLDLRDLCDLLDLWDLCNLLDLPELANLSDLTDLLNLLDFLDLPEEMQWKLTQSRSEYASLAYLTLLDTSSHLYNRLCLSIHPSLGWSVGSLLKSTKMDENQWN